MPLTAGTQRYRWTVRPPQTRAADLAASLRIAPLLAQVLLNRGIDSAETGHAFLSPSLRGLIRPQDMPGMAAGVTRLRAALDRGERITLYGDYDVDGITGVSILLLLLRHLGASVDYYIPHRLDEGYGLNTAALRSLAEAGTKLLITVDCGISAVETVALAAESGVDVIVTDHHPPGPNLPRAAAIVHPLLEPDYANPNSAGALVAFKLAWALADAVHTGPPLPETLRRLMLEATSLASVGTVADVVDLRGENRILTHFGLKSLAQSQLCGVQALFAAAGLAGKGVDSHDVGFKLGPMLNAAGRMGHARLAVELLTCDNERRARSIAEYLTEQNQLRQRCGRKIFQEACQRVRDHGLHGAERRSIVLAGEDWHRGVLGIVASRLVETFYRPTIVVSRLDDDPKRVQGSGRSIPGFSLLAGIRACADHLDSFGGHAMAAGLSLATDRVAAFSEAFEAYARAHLKPDDLHASLTIDAVTPLSALRQDTVTQLRRLGPFGAGNTRPVFATRGVRLISPPRRVGAQGDHLQLAITDNTQSLRCIGFGMGKLEKRLLEAEAFDVAYEADLNSYRGLTQVQLVLSDVQIDD